MNTAAVASAPGLCLNDRGCCQLGTGGVPKTSKASSWKSASSSEIGSAAAGEAIGMGALIATSGARVHSVDEALQDGLNLVTNHRMNGR